MSNSDVKTTNPEREEGFYWIRSSGDPEVALWEGGSWWLAGDDDDLPDAGATILSEKLSEPTP